MIAWITVLSVAPAMDLPQIDALYREARYEEALQALGETCVGSADQVTCERLRAYVNAALDNAMEAQAAFARMLLADPNIELDDDMSPSLRELFRAASEMMASLSELQLETVAVPSDQAPWEIVLKTGRKVGVAAVTAHVRPPGAEEFYPVTLSEQEEGWVGVFKPPNVSFGTAHYFLAIQLQGGGEFFLGGRDEPKTFEVRLTRGALHDVETVPPYVLPPDTMTATDPAQAEGLPDWAFWSLIGAGALVVVAGTTTAILLASKEPEPGAIRLTISFGDTP